MAPLIQFYTPTFGYVQSYYIRMLRLFLPAIIVLTVSFIVLYPYVGHFIVLHCHLLAIRSYLR
jgi:hypothetical protein